MKKKLTITLVISLIVFAISVTALTILIAVRNNTKHALTVECQRGGYVELKINNEKYKVDENTSEELFSKRKDEITLTAKNFEHFTFDAWFKDGKAFSTETEITIKVEDDVKYFASFDEITYELTVGNKSYTYGSSENLLIALKREFAPSAGYTHKYFIGENEITVDTVITSDTEIRIEKSLITYTITYTHNDQEVEVKEYNVENLDANQNYYPELPTATQGYTIAWETYNLSAESLSNITVETVETPITYTATFKHKGEVIGTDTFTVEYNILTYPEIPAEEVETGKEYRWDAFDFETNFNYEDITIETVYDFINYSLTFNLNDGEFSTSVPSTYTIENEIQVPNPTKEGYTFLGWTGSDLADYTFDLVIATGSMGNKEYTANWELISAKVKLGTLSNVTKVYYGTDTENITTELTTEGFVADAETQYFFKAELVTTEGLEVVTFVGFSGAFETTSLATEAITFKPVAEDTVYEINATAKIDTAVRYSISYDIEFKDDNPFPYNALYFVNNELYTYKNNKLNYIMSAEEYANTYYEVVSPQNGIYHVYSINGETVTSVEDFKTQLIAIMTSTETTSIEIIYD